MDIKCKNKKVECECNTCCSWLDKDYGREDTEGFLFCYFVGLFIIFNFWWILKILL